jgi:molybdopterin synthase catalytic subunit
MVDKIMPSNAGTHRKGALSLEDIITSMKAEPNFKKAGAVAVFIGVVRGEDGKDRKVQKLELEAYEEKANETLKEICSDLKRKTGIVDVQVHHLLGEFEVGEDLVYVLVAGSHREYVFPVLEEAVDRYKKEASIFKKEYVVNGKGETHAYWKTENTQ